MPKPPRPEGRRHLVLGAAVLVCALLATTVPAAARPAAADPRYRPPVDAPVVDPFRPPDRPYGPGNRGLEYGTEPGTEVRAAADGVVTFAGLVAGSRHVTVLHEDGLRTTASYLHTVAVLVGQRVAQGDVLGTTVGHLHFSARRGDAYLDPAALFEAGSPRVHLVPFDRPPGAGSGGERSAIQQLLGLGAAAVGVAGAVLDGTVDAGQDVVAWAADQSGELARLVAEYGPLFVPLLRTALLVQTTFEVVQRAWEIAHRPCTEDHERVEPPATRHVAVLVAGLGSTSESGSIDDLDVDALGYAPRDVVRFSYAGGRVPDLTDGFVEVDPERYGSGDTQEDLRRSGAHLADLVEELAVAAPGVPIDLYAHSQGGVVTRLALIELERRHGRAWLERVGLVATIATPHGGADLATAVRAIGLFPAGDVALDLVQPVVGLDDDAPNAAQLSESSDVVRDLADHPVPEGVPAISIAARGDLVVPVPRARFEGAREVTVPLVGPTAHAELPGHPRTTRELALALAGAPPACTSFASALADQAFGAGISHAEDGAGAALTVLSALGSAGRMGG